MMRKAFLALAVLLSMAVPAMAVEPFVGLVDLERGLVLIPEGTAAPRGVHFFVRSESESAERDVRTMRRFLYVHAPAERFIEPRARIAATQPRDVRALVDNLDQTYYFYYGDGSYHGARKSIINYTYNTNYGVNTFAYSIGGDYDARVNVSQTSSWTGYNVSRSCTFYGTTSATCGTPQHAYAAGPSWTATVTTNASITRYIYPPCDYPCKQNLSSTIVITFP